MSQVDRTILFLLYRILAKVEDDKSYDVSTEILENGYVGKYSDILLSSEEISAEICRETTDILQMYRVLRIKIHELTEEQANQLDTEKMEFEGFDNHESHFHYATFLIEKMNLWREYKERDIDSHSATSINEI